MVVAWLILALSMAMFFFYFQTTCQRILRRQFDWESSQSVAKVVGLEFPSLRKSLEEFGAPLDYPQLRMMLKRDFLALTYLLKSASNVDRRYSNEERLLILYFRWQFFWLPVRCLLKVGEKKASLKLTSVLQYFANVVGQRVKTLQRFANALDVPLYELFNPPTQAADARFGGAGSYSPARLDNAYLPKATIHG